MLLVRRNPFFLRAYAFATTPPNGLVQKASSHLFSSLSEQRIETSSSAEKYLSITKSSTTKTFGGLCYAETPDSLQRVIFVLGGPGSGKGTQSDLILQNYPCVHLSAGQLLRDETSKEGSPHAKMIEDCLVAGKIVPVEISLALLAQAMQAAPGKSMVFLVDGFPRNFDNLDGWTAGMPNVASVSGVLHYDCPLEVLEKRVLERAKDSGRSDDNLESLRKRFNTFNKDTMPVVDILRKVAEESTSMKVFEIEANRPIDSVWADTQKSLNSVIANDILAQNDKLLDAIAAKDAETYTRLCADAMVDGSEPSEFLKSQELDDSNEGQPDCISKAQMEFITGTKVKVSYRRSLGDAVFQEARIWSYTRDGWKMIHFFRSPVESPSG